MNLFHALGKVFYNKRNYCCCPNSDSSLTDDTSTGVGDPGIDEEDQEELAVIKGLAPQDPLPPHMETFERRKSMTSLEVRSA